MPARWLQGRSTLAFLAACLVLVAIKLLFDFYPGDYPVRGQAEAFTWPLVGGIVAIGFAGLLAERASGFPDAFADPRRERRGWIVAGLAGIAYGLLTAARDYFIEGGGNVLNLSDWAHVAWPWSLPFYTFGAIFLELLLRLGALCLLVWLIHVVILRRRWRMPVFWTVNLIVSFYEIMPMTMADIADHRWLAIAATPLEPLYWTNVFEGWLLLRFGWFAPIVFRLAFYLVWHVVYGGLGPF
jgi:hypothetical protein